jgi:hypothetical protein
MYTRQEYLEQKCSHRNYYGQFVTQQVLSRVMSYIGSSVIVKSKDPHFNDIPLARWDAMFPTCPGDINNAMRACGDYPTKAGLVCIAKEAAKQIQEAMRDPIIGGCA